MSTVSLSSGKQFACEASETLLEAASRAGVRLPYSCKTGRCSTCRVQVLQGETTAKADELGLSAQDKADGFVLSCVRSACGDVMLEVEDLGDVVIPSARMLPCRIAALEYLAPDVLRVMLRTPPTQKLECLPGQYIDIIGPGNIRRSYSVANAVSVGGQIELHVRQVSNGALSAYWFGQAQANDLLRLNGPLGTFFLRSVLGKHVVFLATGTGIAPVKAMLEGMECLALDQRPLSISVYWGGRVASDLYWQPPSVIAGVPVNYVPVLSRASDEWLGARGYVQQALLAQSLNWGDVQVYACGSDHMIESARRALLDVGLSARAFYSDAFVCSAS